jgi:hypothetical protein
VKKLSGLAKNFSIFNPKKVVTQLSEKWFRIWDPKSGIGDPAKNLSQIPDPGVKKAHVNKKK